MQKGRHQKEKQLKFMGYDAKERKVSNKNPVNMSEGCNESTKPRRLQITDAQGKKERKYFTNEQGDTINTVVSWHVMPEITHPETTEADCGHSCVFPKATHPESTGADCGNLQAMVLIGVAIYIEENQIDFNISTQNYDLYRQFRPMTRNFN